MDAGLAIWAAQERCGKSKQSNDVKCTIDILAVVDSVSKVISHITGAVTQCGELNTVAGKCAQAATKLTSGASVVAVAGAKMHEKCMPQAPRSAGESG
jgi:hypothetical protein